MTAPHVEQLTPLAAAACLMLCLERRGARFSLHDDDLRVSLDDMRWTGIDLSPDQLARVVLALRSELRELLQLRVQ